MRENVFENYFDDIDFNIKRLNDLKLDTSELFPTNYHQYGNILLVFIIILLLGYIIYLILRDSKQKRAQSTPRVHFQATPHEDLEPSPPNTSTDPKTIILKMSK